MNPVECVQEFSFCLGGPSKFIMRVGSWRSWFTSPVHGKYQMYLPGTISLEWGKWARVCRHPCLEWSIPQERQGNSVNICFPCRFPLTNWIPPIWPSFYFLRRITKKCSTCCKTHIGTRHPQRVQNVFKAFPSVHHPSNPKEMHRQTLSFFTTLPLMRLSCAFRRSWMLFRIVTIYAWLLGDSTLS